MLFFFKIKNLKTIGGKYNISRIYKVFANLRKIYAGAKPIFHFNINFETPTYFNTLKGNFPIRLPIPAVIFSNLIRLWNSISISNDIPAIDHKTLINWIESHIYVSKCEIKTKLVHIGKPKRVGGFLGIVYFNIKKPNRNYYELFNQEEIMENYLECSRDINFLCKIAEYTNLGVNRTASMGVIKYNLRKKIGKNYNKNREW